MENSEVTKLLHQYDDEQIENAKKSAKELFLSLGYLDNNRLNKTFEIGDYIIDKFRNKQIYTVILNAPTGFGKSILAFYVSQIFNALNLSTYILTPNKFLQEQYAKDVDKFNLPQTIMLKGAGNYVCSVNNKTINDRYCSDYSFSDVINKTPAELQTCFPKCLYMQLRKKAINSNVNVINYAFWLMQMNFVQTKLIDKAPFKIRDLTIFDESHSIGSIAQNQFSTSFDVNTFIRKCMSASKIIEFLFNEQFSLSNSNDNMYVNLINAIIRLQSEYGKHREWQMSDFSTVKKEWEDVITSIQAIIDKIATICAKLTTRILNRHPEIATSQVVKHANSDEKIVFDLYTYIQNILSNFLELDSIFSNFSYKSMSFTIKVDKESAQIAPYGEYSQYICTFNCAQEASIIKSKMNAFTKYSIFMSATFGNIDDFAEQSGIDNYEKVEVPIQFGFEKSPIYMLSNPVDMSYKNKSANMYELVRKVDAYCNAHKNQRGIIHTGNFEIMQQLQKLGNPRILCYDTKNKSEVLKKFASMHNGIICGPSLIEGIDLKDDLARFMIFCKVPFMSLGDELVKRKMQIYTNWYNWITMAQIEQGLGRGIRNHNDWCETLLLDAQFEQFFNRYEPPEYIKQRLKYVNFSDLIGQYNEVSTQYDARNPHTSSSTSKEKLLEHNPNIEIKDEWYELDDDLPF